MSNKTFHITVQATDADIAADRLWQLGVEAVGIGDPIDGQVELWTSVGASDEAIERAVAVLDTKWTWRTADVVAPDETWREHVGPSWYSDRGVVVPRWQIDEVDLADRDDVLVTVIEPASSFGLGDHPTTRLSLGALAAVLDVRSEPPFPARLLDVGCGSGVLGIMAAQRSVASIRSIDISTGAVEATIANAHANGVAERVEADMADLDSLSGPYDVVVANILAPVLSSMADDLRRLTALAGTLIISGILADRHQHVLDALTPMRVVDSSTSDGWAAVSLRH